MTTAHQFAATLAQAAADGTGAAGPLILPDWLSTVLVAAVLAVTGYGGKVIRTNGLRLTAMEAGQDARLKALERDVAYIRERIDALADRGG